MLPLYLWRGAHVDFCAITLPWTWGLCENMISFEHPDNNFRDAETGKASEILPFVLQSEAAEQVFAACEEKNRRRKQARESAKLEGKTLSSLGLNMPHPMSRWIETASKMVQLGGCERKPVNPFVSTATRVNTIRVARVCFSVRERCFLLGDGRSIHSW